MNGGGDDAAAGGAGLRRCDHEASSPEKTILNRIMLRYRPIAPKPTGVGAVQGAEAGNGVVGAGRRKRRYVRVSGGKRSGNCSRREKSPSGNRSDEEEEEVKTLRLLPDESAKEEPEEGRDPGPLDLKRAEIQRPRIDADVAAESWVTVLGLTNACMDRLQGCTDEERWTNLEADTCPAFLSDDGNHRVVWSNAAYRRMVVGDEDAGGVKVAVNLAVEEGVRIPVACPAFACMVRLQYTWRWSMGRCKTAVVPCDVWRMNAGGFAWRLDLKASLSLGLGV